MGFFARRTEIFKTFIKIPLKVASSPRSEKTPGTKFQNSSVSYTCFNFFSHARVGSTEATEVKREEWIGRNPEQSEDADAAFFSMICCILAG